MTWIADRPYNGLPLLPPPVEVEPKRVLRAATEARASLAALDQASRRIQNPAALINSIPVLEAQASSAIENIVTTNDELFKQVNVESAHTDPATKEALRYRSALFLGMDLVRTKPLSVSIAAEICSRITGYEVSVRDLPGTFIGNPTTGKAIYTPPSGEPIIRDKLANWEEFLHTDHALDPLIVMAIAHYQFEAIHPFSDGNGRTGRILNMLYLVSSGLLHLPVLYLSRYIIRNKADYYALLLNVTAHQRWEEWILFMLEGLRSTAASTVRKIDAIDALQQDTLSIMRDSTKAGGNADLLAVLFEQPYCRIADVVARCHVSRPTATSWLNSLVEADVLSDIRAGRERLFINTRFVTLLTREDEFGSGDRASPGA